MQVFLLQLRRQVKGKNKVIKKKRPGKLLQNRNTEARRVCEGWLERCCDNKGPLFHEAIETGSNSYLIPGHKTTTILLDGKRVKLQLWDTSGQGRFCTIIRSYSRGAQGILLVYDITNKWSFEGLDRWMKEIQEVLRIMSLCVITRNLLVIIVFW